MLLIVVAERLAHAFGCAFPILRADFSIRFFGLLFQGPIRYGTQAQAQILPKILLEVILFYHRAAQKFVALLKLLPLAALFCLQGGAPLSRVAHPLLLVLHLPIQLSAPLCPGSVFRSAQELLDHPDPRLRDLHLFPRLGIGPALRVCLVAELGNAVLRPLNRVGRMEQIAVANSQRAQQRLIRFRGVQRLLIGFFCPHVGKSAAQFTALLFKESNDLLS